MFGDNFLVKLCIFSFHVWKNKLASLQWPLLSFLISCCGDKSPYFFEVPNSHIINLFINQHFQPKHCIKERSEGGVSFV